MIDVRQLIPLEIQLQEYVSLFLYKLKTVNWIPSLILISGFLFSPESKSDTWLDPTWKQMLDSSEVVAMIQYTSNGSFRASAKVLAVYKGDLKTGDEIWISGFSNRYGPIDKVRYGDKYLVFLNRNQYVEQLYDDSDKWREYVWGTYHVDIETILMLTVLTGGLLVVFSLFRSVSAGKSRASVEWSALLMMIVVWCWHMGLRDLASAFKKRPAYSVSSPSSGDLKVYGDQVRYDLISTTYHREQSFYALETFESFLFAYYQKTNPREFCNILTDEISPANSSVSNTQRLMQLFLLGYNTHHEVFEKYINVDNAASRFALAQLVGNIKTAQSRNILVALLADENTLVQGEAVRQLKTWPPEDVAPILLAHLKSSSELNSGPSNIMDPVGNSIKGGRAEIIEALGDLKYNEAVPDLLSLLDTNNEYLFELVINALKKIGSKQYVIYINKHLDNKTYSLISSLSMMIAKDSLIECLPSFKNFIATCDRNQNLTEYTISTYSGIGRFKDASTTSFLLADFARFFSYKDTLDCLNERSWTSQYINTFTELGAQAARPLIYKSIYDWFGFNEDFSLQPRLFQIKKNLEDSLRFVFTKKFESEGYSIGRCIAFIQNTGEAAQGRKPSMKFLIECTVPYTKTEGESIRKVIANEVNLPVENVYLRFDNDVYHSEVQYRFSQSLSSTPLEAFLGYAEAMPDSTDVAFLQALVDHNVLPAADDISRIKKVTVSIIQDLQNEKGP